MIFILPFTFTNKTLYLSCWLRGNSALPLLNEKLKVVNSCVKNNTDLNNYGSKLFASRGFLLSKSLCNNWYAIVLTGVRMKPPKDINYISFECNYFPKSPPSLSGINVLEYESERDWIWKLLKLYIARSTLSLTLVRSHYRPRIDYIDGR